MTPPKRFDITGIGHAIVDILAHVDDNFISQHHLNKGTMALIDEATAQSLYDQLPPATEVSGGSAANTVAGVAVSGGNAAFIGKVRDDQFGTIFSHDLRSLNIHFPNQASAHGPSTARSYVLVTPDAERTMQTYLGIASHLTEEDIDDATIQASKTLFVEGYLWDLPDTKQALAKAFRVAKEANTKAAFSLSDPFCVNRHRDAFLELASNSLDILFANEEEIKSLFTAHELEEAYKQVPNLCETVIVTRSAKGADVYQNGQWHSVPQNHIDNVVDTTGAGDLFAAGFLHGYSKDEDPSQCATRGNQMAGKVIQQLGARLQECSA